MLSRSLEALFSLRCGNDGLILPARCELSIDPSIPLTIKPSSNSSKLSKLGFFSCFMLGQSGTCKSTAVCPGGAFTSGISVLLSRNLSPCSEPREAPILESPFPTLLIS